MAKSKPLKGKYETTDGSKKKPEMKDDLFDAMFGNKDIADKKKKAEKDIDKKRKKLKEKVKKPKKKEKK
jgi:hypothetical protein